MYDCWLAFELAFVYLFIVETKGLSLEETAALFDGGDAAGRIAGLAGHAAGNIMSTTDEKDSAEFRETSSKA